MVSIGLPVKVTIGKHDTNNNMPFHAVTGLACCTEPSPTTMASTCRADRMESYSGWVRGLRDTRAFRASRLRNQDDYGRPMSQRRYIGSGPWPDARKNESRVQK